LCPTIPYTKAEERFLRKIGPQARAELLAALPASVEDRAARIGRLHVHADADLIAELLIELEVNEPARLRFIGVLRDIRAREG
jgi:hypothetical protein